MDEMYLLAPLGLSRDFGRKELDHIMSAIESEEEKNKQMTDPHLFRLAIQSIWMNY